MPAPIGDTNLYRHPRPTRDQTLMRQAQIIAERSTCSRAQVGVVIAHEGRIVSQGYNGAPVGMPHCDHTCNCSQDTIAGGYPTEPVRIIHEPGCPSFASCTVAVHAEANAVAFAAKYGISTQGGFLFTTMAPCVPCSQLIINAGIVRVVYAQPYRYNEGLTLLMNAGIPAERG